MKKLFILPLVGLFCLFASPVMAQEQPTQQPSTEELETQKAEREKNAYRLLDQVIDEAQSLRLAENRVRVQINGADMLWDQNEGRARSLFSMAAEGVAELGRTQTTSSNRRNQATQDDNSFSSQRPVGPQNLRVFQLRQELVLAAARHDAALAYQLLAATKPPMPNVTEARGPRGQLTSDDNLEQTLLGRIAALDPKLAAQNAEQMMDKGQFPLTIPEVLNQLYRQDPDAAEKLADKTVKRLQAANILTKPETTGLVQTLLRAGPRAATEITDPSAKPQTNSRSQVLPQSSYVDLLLAVVEAGLKATPATQNNQRGGTANLRVRRVPGPLQVSPAQNEQNNARRLLGALQVVMPLIDQYLPSKASLVRQKMVEMGFGNTSPVDMAQTFNALRGEVTVDALVQAAATAPQQIQARLYQQAAYKALEEGDTERAKQIATDHLSTKAREILMERIDFREMAKKVEGARFEDIRQSVARLQSDNEKIDLLIQVARDAQKINPKLALQLLDEAKQIVNHRATGYEHFEQQLKVSRAFTAVDPARSFEMLEAGISQLNELLSAAAVLSGFEINMFRDGEMAIQAGNGLTSTINRYGQELAVLARNDFERSETLAGRFQFAEPRIIARLAIVQGLLGVKPASDSRTVLGNLSENVIIR